MPRIFRAGPDFGASAPRPTRGGHSCRSQGEAEGPVGLLQHYTITTVCCNIRVIAPMTSPAACRHRSQAPIGPVLAGKHRRERGCSPQRRAHPQLGRGPEMQSTSPWALLRAPPLGNPSRLQSPSGPVPQGDTQAAPTTRRTRTTMTTRALRRLCREAGAPSVCRPTAIGSRTPASGRAALRTPPASLWAGTPLRIDYAWGAKCGGLSQIIAR